MKIKIEQVIFDNVANHLLTQKRKSIIIKSGKALAIATGCDVPKEVCAYRDGKGNSCAIGCLIPDVLYDTSLENQFVLNDEIYSIIHRQFGEVDIDLLVVLQKCHDLIPVESWKERLIEIAREWNLSNEVIRGFK